MSTFMTRFAGVGEGISAFLNCNPSLPHQINMQATLDQSLLTRLQGLAATTDPSPSQQAVAQEQLLRLFRPGSAQTIATSPDNTLTATLSDASINDPAPTAARRSPAPTYCGETCSTASAPMGTSGETRASASDYDVEAWLAHLNSESPIDRVGRLEVLNDVSGRELRVYRKSPARRARHSSDESDTEDVE